MKFLHTADLHLGRSLHERSLLEDQRAMLDSLIAALGSDDYAALLIAGDVYDRSIPSPESVELLGSFLAELRRRFPGLAVVIACGNHDSPERLSYGDELFRALDIHIVSDPEKSFKPVIVAKDGERCAVFVLPFLTAGSLRGTKTVEAGAEAQPLRSQKDLAEEAAARLEEARTKALADGAGSAVLLAHLFASGGAESESERAFLGTAERVDAGLFRAFDYVALGHLHRVQQAGENAWYSGSPLAYSFDEAAHKKSFLAVSVGADKRMSVKELPVEGTRKVTRLKGSFESFMTPGAHAANKDDYLEIALSDGHLVENPLALLRQRYPNLLSVRQDEALERLGTLARDDGAASRLDSRRNVADDFSVFLEELYGSERAEEVELFKMIAAEAQDASS